MSETTKSDVIEASEAFNKKEHPTDRQHSKEKKHKADDIEHHRRKKKKKKLLLHLKR